MDFGVYEAYTHGLISKWTHIMRTIPDIGHLLKPLKKNYPFQVHTS